MEQGVQIKYINAKLQIGVVNWRQVFLLHPKVTPMMPEVAKGRLVYRVKGSTKRISYTQIKKGLTKKDYWLKEEVHS